MSSGEHDMVTAPHAGASHPADGHLVGGQGAGLVGADDGGAAQRLHRGQGAHNGVLASHAPGAQRQTGGDHSRET